MTDVAIPIPPEDRALAAMTLTLISNNLGIMWVGIEATTLMTAFLICIHVTPASLEAMWKYLLICSVGVAFAFLGTLLVAASDGDDDGPAVRQLRQRRRQQRQFADTGIVGQQFDQLSLRPAAARQFTVEFGEAAGQHRGIHGAGRCARNAVDPQPRLL